MSMPEAFDAVDVIRAKRDNNRLSDPMIDWVIDAYTRGVVTSDQMAALAMAIFLNGMSREEIVTWTTAMMNSGIRMNFDSLGRPTADKHSTGGVGDKITLPLAPLVAVFGVAVPQLSGRGLGHTGGTLDKMESIKGWQAEVSDKQMMEMLGQNGPGAVICAASADLAPADKKLYALRDVTATVDCIPLIASSIMSKKIAEGTDSLVLDVKVGSGAFMKDQAQARALAETMVALGTDAGVRTSALLTNMSTPLGLMIGNALEVQEYAFPRVRLPADVPAVAAHELAFPLVEVIQRQLAVRVRNAHGNKRGFIRVRLLHSLRVLLGKEPAVVDGLFDSHENISSRWGYLRCYF